MENVEGKTDCVSFRVGCITFLHRVSRRVKTADA
jgi:hypothetical protein